MTASGTKTKALCVGTRCTSVDQFISTFHRFCGENQSFFVATLTSRPVGLETAFSIQLADKQPVLRGLCVVLDAWATPANEFKRPGIRLGIKRLTPDSQIVYDRLRAASLLADATPPPGTAVEPSRAELAAATATAAMPRPDATPTPRKAAPTPPAIKRMQVALRVGTTPPPINVADFAPAPPRRSSDPLLPGAPEPPAPEPPAPPEPLAEIAKPLEVVEAAPSYADSLRTPGSELVLPANPLQNLSDESLEGFVECTLYEDETGSTYADDLGAEDPLDPLAEPPVVPALPFDEAPRLMLDAEGETETLRVAPLSPHAFTQPAPRDSVPAAALSTELVSAAQQWVASRTVTGTHPPFGEPPPPPPALALGSAHGMEREAEAVLATPIRSTVRTRWLLIVGCAVGAFVLMFTFALLVRGRKDDAAQVAAAPPPPPSPPAPAHRPAPPPPPAPAQVAAAVPKAVDPVPEEEPEAPGAPVVGGGPCKLVVATTPAGSMISLDDQAIGPSPLTIASTCAKHKLDIVHARYQAATKWVTLSADKPETIDVALNRPIHAVMVTSLPPGADVLIDGHRAGTTPTMVQLMGFVTVSLTFSKPGFPTVTKKLYSKVPKDHLFVKLTK